MYKSIMARDWRKVVYSAVFLFVVNVLNVRAHDEDTYTIQYDSETFAYKVPTNNHFVMFYAPWCGHCKRLAPTWEQLAEMLNNEKDTNILIAKVDCTTDNKVCSENDVTGYPTLKFFKVGEKEGVKFRGTRDLPSLSSFINEQLGQASSSEDEKPPVPEPVNGLVELTEDNFDKHVSLGKHFVKFYAPWCGHCQKLAPVWEQLAQTMEHDSTVNIAKVDCTQHRSVCNQFDVKGYPTLLWIEDGKKVDKYQGHRSHEEFKNYVSKMIGSTDSGNNEEKVPEVSSPVLTLTGDNFEHGIENGISLVKFFAPWCGHCKRLSPTWEDLAKKFIQDSSVHIVKVDCTLETSKQLCNEQEVDGFPTLFLYKDGQKVSEYTGTRTLEDLHEFIISHRGHDEL